jgi:hypothetical protein
MAVMRLSLELAMCTLLAFDDGGYDREPEIDDGDDHPDAVAETGAASDPPRLGGHTSWQSSQP